MPVTFESLTPVVYVERIEPCLEFWIERLGFRVTAEVREGADLGFVLLERDGVPLMLQSRESLRKDVPALGEMPFRSSTALYFRLRDLAGLEPRLAGLDVVVPRRRTFYGATEIVVRDPAGNLVCLSEHDER
jgi:hypothetical protein